MRSLLACGCLALAGMAPQGGQLLAYDAVTLAADACLAPAFEGAGCAGQRRGHAGAGGALSASAALLPPDTPLAMQADEEMLRPGDEITYWCGEPECSSPRRIILAAS